MRKKRLKHGQYIAGLHPNEHGKQRDGRDSVLWFWKEQATTQGDVIARTYTTPW